MLVTDTDENYFLKNCDFWGSQFPGIFNKIILDQFLNIDLVLLHLFYMWQSFKVITGALFTPKII